ncbi:MAG: hypothetical protein ACRDDY_17710 [Clostridium sp.]|uniref:hypothetical protein n=1 Tax=Clostridium sp. TaxID=1506 RepID=UPI003EE7169D
MNDIKMLVELEGKVTFKSQGSDCIVLKGNKRIGVYNKSIEDVKEYCIINNIEVNFI